MITPFKKSDFAQAREFFERKRPLTTNPVEINAQIESHAGLVIVDVRVTGDFEEGHKSRRIRVAACTPTGPGSGHLGHAYSPESSPADHANGLEKPAAMIRQLRQTRHWDF